MIDWNHPVIVGLPMALLTYYGYRISQKKDAEAVRSGAASNGRAGMNILVDQLQEHVRFLTERLDATTTERDALKLELAKVKKKHGLNDDNGPTS